MARTNFENLRVYQLSEELADSVWEIASKWNNFSRDTIGKQIVKSADSVGANIAEGTGRYGIQDNKRFGYFARGSLSETKHWLRRAFKPLLEKLSPRLNAYINSIKPSASGVTSRATNDEQLTTNQSL